MRHTVGTCKSPGEKIVKDIKRATRKQYSCEEKIRIALGGLRGDDSISELCRREWISQGKEIVTYSLRRTFIDHLRLAGHMDHEIGLIVGHDKPSMTGR